MTASTQDRPGAIDARPVRHPGRWVAVVLIAVVAAMIISSFVTNEKWNFPFAFEIMQQSPVIEGLWKGTIFGTVGAMILGIGLGVVLAVMRLSTNPVLRGVAFVYTWFFRAIPRYVLLVLLGTGIGFLYPAFDIGVPFGQQIADLLGLDTNLTFFSLDYNSISSTIWVGILGLGLSEAAYMAEIARAGILSVDKGQAEAAQALGMPPGKTMRRVVLPQAMRVIVPPTGNETIAMVKDTSLLVGGARDRRAVLPELPVRPAQLPDHARHRRRDDLVPHRLLGPDGRAVAPGALLRPRLRGDAEEGAAEAHRDRG